MKDINTSALDIVKPKICPWFNHFFIRFLPASWLGLTKKIKHDVTTYQLSHLIHLDCVRWIVVWTQHKLQDCWRDIQWLLAHCALLKVTHSKRNPAHNTIRLSVCLTRRAHSWSETPVTHHGTHTSSLELVIMRIIRGSLSQCALSCCLIHPHSFILFLIQTTFCSHHVSQLRPRRQE